MSTLRYPRPVNRRHFLKVSGLTAVASFAISPLALAFDHSYSSLKVGVKEYRGTDNGKLLLSTDQGKTWTEIANFGDDCSVENITAELNGLVKVHLRKGAHSIWIQSDNDQKWVTENYIPPTKF
ncbi:hypothetical protein [Methylomonas sp. AM2-LC]|uniref:hypothetical protein n=1 Tax=Methylomonas sp. AM2-LC TaxID=3153301 RepID=UPI0032678ABF